MRKIIAALASTTAHRARDIEGDRTMSVEAGSKLWDELSDPIAIDRLRPEFRI